MLMYPSTRKGLITEPTSVPFHDSVRIQDDHFLPEFSHEASYYYQQQPRLQSPFQQNQFVSPPSSVPSSPTFSSPSSIAYPPSAVAADYPAASFDGSLEAPSMTPASSYNPSLHSQQFASPQLSQSYLPQYSRQYLIDNSMLTQQPVANSHNWEGNLQFLGGPAPNGLQRQLQDRKPSPSALSNHSVHAHRRSNSSNVKPLPTPVQTPVQNSFLATPFQNYDPSSHDAHAQAELAMRQAMMEQQQRQHQHQTSDYSLPSASSVSHNSPVTPQTNFEELDDTSKAISTGEIYRVPNIDQWMDEYLQTDALSDYGNNNASNLSMGIPKLNRTISDIYQDELYNSTIMTTPQVPKQASGQNLLTPYRNVFADRLQAANQGHMSARSQSPVMGSMNRDRSPFRQGSPLAAEFSNAALQQSQMATSMPMSQNTSMGMGQVHEQPKTMSPKDALLDFDNGEDAAMPPLFPGNQADFNLGDTLGLRRESSGSFRAAQNFVTMDSLPTQYATAGMSQQYPMQQQERRSSSQQTPQNYIHHSPEFPAPLPTLESTNSEVLPSTEMTSPSQSTIQMQPIKQEITRPDNTFSDSGTYTCTYHGCSQRFETPAKLQKHKREAHRQTTPGGHLVGREAASRNSQAGPHKCERINPSTGKPCNSVFSRPYDLTRHEDTIHNNRKQKVRCHLCTEEKTFSRNDALTRHMRVVHPEVDWPGKQRRRGRD